MVYIGKAEIQAEAIQRIMNGLKCSAKEAQEIFEYDCAVDKGEKTEYDLSPDKAKVAQKFAHAGIRTPTAYKFTQRQRKPNATKGGIVSELAEFLSNSSQFSVENLQIVNKERQLSFVIGGEIFELTLVQKRKPKK